MRIAEQRVDGGERAGVLSWVRAHPVDLVFGLIILAAFVALRRATAGNFLFSDDWALLGRDDPPAFLRRLGLEVQ